MTAHYTHTRLETKRKDASAMFHGQLLDLMKRVPNRLLGRVNPLLQFAARHVELICCRFIATAGHSLSWAAWNRSSISAAARWSQAAP